MSFTPFGPLTADEDLLVPPPPVLTDPLEGERLERIRSEVEHGFATLGGLGPAVVADIGQDAQGQGRRVAPRPPRTSL